MSARRRIVLLGRGNVGRMSSIPSWWGRCFMPDEKLMHLEMSPTIESSERAPVVGHEGPLGDGLMVS